MKKDKRGQAAIISNDEFSRIRKQIRSQKYKLMLDIAWYTGERYGAIIQLRIEDVYNPDGTVKDKISFLVRAGGNSEETAQTRQVPIHNVLRQNLQIYNPGSDSPWLFPNRDGSKNITLRNAAGILSRAVDRAGLTSKGISTHSFRRSFVVRLHNNGTSAAVIKEITGYKDMKTLEQYMDVTDNQIQGAIATL